MSSFPSLPERLNTIATECSFAAAAYSPTEIIRFLDGKEDHRLKNLLLSILRSHKDAFNPNNIEMDPRVEYALTQAEKNPAIICDGRTPTDSQLLSEFSCILRIAAEMDEKIEALAEQTSKDPKAIEDGLFEILVESSRVVPDKPDTMDDHRAIHAVELFGLHHESKGLMIGLGENGARSLVGRINEAVGGHKYSQTPACVQIVEVFEKFNNPRSS